MRVFTEMNTSFPMRAPIPPVDSQNTCIACFWNRRDPSVICEIELKRRSEECCETHGFRFHSALLDPVKRPQQSDLHQHGLRLEHLLPAAGDLSVDDQNVARQCAKSRFNAQALELGMHRRPILEADEKLVKVRQQAH